MTYYFLNDIYTLVAEFITEQIQYKLIEVIVLNTLTLKNLLVSSKPKAREYKIKPAPISAINRLLHEII